MVETKLDWGIIRPYNLCDDEDHLCIKVRKDEVIMVQQECSVYYPFGEPIKPTQAPHVDDLASILSGVPKATLVEIASFCSEPRTMAEVEEKFPGVEAWRLRSMGFLVDVGKRGRRIILQWQGYQWDHLIKIMLDQYQRSKR